jgi:MoxR-like ATPase
MSTLSERPPQPAADADGRSSNAPPPAARLEALRRSLNGALRGKEDVIELVLAALLARGHLLIEDLPGLGKTTLAKALAWSIGGKFCRIQCTPDLLPGDVTGFSIFNQQTRSLEFVPGPVFADVLLADEINRATPRTQSALLEVMAERQVTVDNVTRPLSDRFFVIATQNPVEMDGTFPLPEAQLDRFAMKVRIGHPDREHVMEMLEASVGMPTGASPLIDQVILHDELIALQQEVSRVAVSPAIREYLADLGEAIRRHRRVRLGASPRGLLIWLRLAQAWATLQGRSFVTPDDIQAVALPVLEVRLSIDDADPSELIAEVLDGTPAPVYPR